MPAILGITALFLLATDVLQWDLTFTTGLSAKNALLYMIATFLALRMVVARTSVLAAGQMQAAFLIQICYAIFSWLVASLVIHYPGYDLVANGIRLKGDLVDFFIFFVVFLFAITTAEGAIKVIKALLLGAIFANAMTILDAAGIINLGFQERLDGRTQGALGEANQYAAFIILFIPGMIAAAVAARGVQRLFWLGGAFLSCASLVMTGSRGGFVGAAIAIALGLYLYRHLISYSRVSGWVLGSLIAFILVIGLSQYGALLTERIGKTGNIDVTEASSGRSEIWFNLVTKMFEHPVTLLTGFGWDVYWTFPFRFSPHNHYLALWFNLGLVGLACGAYLLFTAIGRARRASFKAMPPLRGQLIAFVLGGSALCAAVFFVDLHKPWVYFWMYTGVVMRLALCVEASPATAPATAAVPVRRPRARPRDRHGWAVQEREVS
jgi:O-antigen ligase